VIKKQYFALHWTAKQYQKGWKHFQQKKSHWNAKHTSKTRKQLHKHGPNHEKSTVSTPILHNFSHNPQAHILYHRLWYFIQIPYLSKFRATLFGISRFCTKCKACFSPADSRWDKQISPDNLKLIFNFQLYTQPTSTYFISPSLVFHTDSISVKISSNTSRDLETLYKM